MVGDREVRISAVDVVAGKARAGAEIFAALVTKAAMATARTEPRYTDAVANFESIRFSADLDYMPDYFMAWHKHRLRMPQFSVDNVKIRSAYATCGNLDQNLRGVRLDRRNIRKTKRLPWMREHHRSHVVVQCSLCA